MDQIECIHRALETATGLHQVLAAAYAGLLTTVLVTEVQQDPASPHFATFVMAGTMAASARMALIAAPSLPDDSRSADFADGASCRGVAEDITGLLAELTQLMARRLYEAALTAADADDREACSRASHHARQLCALFGGDQAL